MNEESIQRGRKRAELAVILVNHNCQDYLRACLASLEQELKSLAAEVIVIDNDSSDGSQAMVKTSFSWVNLIENRGNVGYARANNQGIRSSSADFILFLNPDTIIPPGSISSLLEELKKRPEAAAIAPRLVRKDGTFQVSFGRRVDFFAEIVQKLLLNSYHRMKLKFTSRPREAGWLSGAFLLVRRQALEEAGLFDENFFLYFEDIDLCYRLKKRGFKLIFFPRIKILHAGGASTSIQKLASRFEYRRSQLYFYKKHNSRLSFFLLKLYLRLVFAFFRVFALCGSEERARWREKTRNLFKRRI